MEEISFEWTSRYHVLARESISEPSAGSRQLARALLFTIAGTQGDPDTLHADLRTI